MKPNYYIMVFQPDIIKRVVYMPFVFCQEVKCQVLRLLDRMTKVGS